MTLTSRTKIVCTIGPKTESPIAIRELLESGMTMARLNGSHNSLDWHVDVIRRIRKIDQTVPIIFDLPGRKIRTAKTNSDFHFSKGDEITLTTDPTYNVKDKVLLNYHELHKDLKAGDVVLADDGTLRFTVINVDGCDIVCRAEIGGTLKPAKGINVPYVQMSAPLVSDTDRKSIEMCKTEGVDFVGVSFVDSGEQLVEVYECLAGSHTEVIAKVENQFALDNLESIIENSFGILIDRGDLGAETKVSNIPLMQKRIIQSAVRIGKPVIVATEMLHTMIENSFPTKSEVNDIANAILDGASALMMSGETAVGAHPYEACKLMREVALETEAVLKGSTEPILMKDGNVSTAIAKCIELTAKGLDISKVVAVTSSGFSARKISVSRPKQPIIVVTDQLEKLRKFNLFWGVNSFLGKLELKPTNSEISLGAIKELLVAGHINATDVILLTGVRYPNPKKNTTMNFVEIHAVKDLIDVFDW